MSPTSPRPREPELLYGVLAVQLGFATPEQVMSAAGAWAIDRSRSLVDRLEREGVLFGERRALLDRAVAEAGRRFASGERPAPAASAPAPADESAKALESFGGSLAATGDGPAAPPLRPEVQNVTPEAPRRYRLIKESGEDLDEGDAQGAEIGRGGIGRVLRAFDEHLGRDVALKELLPGQQGSEQAHSVETSKSGGAAQIARFLREARVTGQLEHPGIPPVYEVGRRDDGTLYYAMRLVRGRTFADVIRDHPGISRDAVHARLRLLPTFVDVCQAVAYAHSRGVVHRDIKPENVMVGEYGETVLLDWGLAKVRGQKDIRSKAIARDLALLQSTDVGKTLQGHAIGTPAYMSPEQGEGRIDAIDEQSDVWSLGAVLYELLTGRPPFQGAGPYEVIGKVIRGDRAAVRTACPEVPGEIAAICEMALRRDKAARYRSARELAADVESYRSGDRVSAYRYSPVERAGRFVSTYRTPLSVAAVAVCALVVTAALAYARVIDERDVALVAKAEAREALTAAFVEKAQWSATHDEEGEAELYAAAALEVTETPEARGILASLEPAGVPSVLWQKRWRGLGCRRVFYVSQGSRLVCDDGHAAILLDAETGEERGRVSIVSRHLTIDDDARTLAAAVGGPEVALFALGTGREVGRLGSGLGEVRVVAFGDGDRLLLTGDDVGVVRVWDRERGEELLALEGHEGPITSLAVAGGGRGRGALLDQGDAPLPLRLAVATEEGPVRVWSLVRDHTPTASSDVSLPDALIDDATGTAPLVASLLRELPLGAETVTFAPDGRRLAVGVGARRAVHLVDVQSGRELAVLTGHRGRVLEASFSGDGVLATAGADQAVALWALPSGQRLRTLQGFYGEVTSVAFDPSGQRVAAADPTVGVRVWTLPEAGRSPSTLEGALGPGKPDLVAMALDDTGGMLAAADTERGVRLVDVHTGEAVRRLKHGLRLGAGVPAHEAELVEVLFAGPGVVAARSQRSAQAWDSATGRSRGLLTEAATTADRLRVLGLFAPPSPGDEAEVLAYGYAGEGDDVAAVTWSLTERAAPRPILGAPAKTAALAFAPDGARYAYGDDQGGVHVVDPRTGTALARFRGPPSAVTHLRFGPGDRLLASWRTGDLIVLDAAHAKPMARLQGQGGELAEAAFSPSGAVVVVVGRDGRVGFWHTAEGGPPRAVLAALPGVTSAVFSPDEEHVYVAGRGRLLRRLRLSPLQDDAASLRFAAERRTGLTLDGTRLLPRWPVLADGVTESAERAPLPPPHLARSEGPRPGTSPTTTATPPEAE